MKKTKKKTFSTDLGSFQLGNEDVRVFVMPKTIGGNVYNFSTRGCPKIEIGIEEEKWSCVVEVLLHEAWELAAMRMGCRYKKTDRFSRSHADYLFQMDHEQMTEIACHVAYFMVLVMPPLKSAWLRNKASKG